MGQKSHPYGLRLGVIDDWQSKWYAESDKFADFLYEDIVLRRYLMKRFEHASLAKVGIERTVNLQDVVIDPQQGIVHPRIADLCGIAQHAHLGRRIVAVA